MTYALSRRGRAAHIWRSARAWRPLKGWYRPKLTWLAPIAPMVMVVAGAFIGVGLPKMVGATVGLLLLLLLSRRPLLCLLIALPFVVLQQMGLPLLWSFGLPGQVARQLGALKDVLVISLVINGAEQVVRTRRKLDVIDKLALGYIAILLLNLFAPQLFYQLLPTTFTTRLLAFRYDGGYILLFLGIRHANLPDNAREKFVRLLLIVTGIIIAGGLWQKFAFASYTNFWLNTAKVVPFSIFVMNLSPAAATQAFAPLEATPVHVGSFLVLSHYMADMLIIALAFVAERAARAHKWRSAIIWFGLIAALIAFAQVRADLIAAAAILALAVLPRYGRKAIARVGLVVMIVLGLSLVLPALHDTRVLGGGNAATSNQAHLGEISLAINLMTHYPLGIGLGNNPATADRFQLPYNKQGALTGDNSLLQVGDELGLVTFIVYTALVVLIGVALFRRGRHEAFPNAAFMAFVGIWIAGMFHHVFLSYPQAVGLWSAVGLALRPRAAGETDEADYAPAEAAALAPATGWD